jgi:hypothetical protein
METEWSVDHQRNEREIKKFLQPIGNENITYQNLWDTAKAVLRGKFVAMSDYIKKSKRCQINSLIMHLKFLEKQKQIKPKLVSKAWKNKNKPIPN